MRVLITGACGFVGAALARYLREQREADGLAIVGLDNLSRAGSETNRAALARLGVELVHGDLRQAADLDACGPADWVIDAAANPSVLAGVDGRTSSRQLVDHNLLGTVNVLEYCKARGAGLVLLSTSRVYSIAPLAALPVEARDGAFRPVLGGGAPPGLGAGGVTEAFPTAAPVSLYGATKLASEALALEYHHTFGLPVWVNRCGVLAGAGQFGHAAQGIYAYWVNAHRRRRPLRYIGFGGSGHQVRDCLHPADLGALVLRQMECADPGDRPRLANVSGGAANSMSLAQLTAWCDERFGAHAVEADHRPRPFDIPWMVLDSHAAARAWDWSPRLGVGAVLEEIAAHAERNPHWLELSGAA